MLPKDDIAWSPYLLFVVKVEPVPDSPDNVFTGSELVIDGNVSGRAFAGVKVVLKVREFDLGMA